MEIILEIAQSVTGGLIANLITKKPKNINKKEVESMVENEVQNVWLKYFDEKHQNDFELLKRQVMDEVDILISRNSDIKISKDNIKLKKSLFPVKKDNNIELELLNWGNQLDKIVTQRREELGLPTQPEEGNSLEIIPREKKVSKETQVNWINVVKKEDTYWAQEIEAMEKRIRNRRLER